MGGVSIISGSLLGAQGAFPARQISYYYYKEKDVLSSFFNLPVLQYDSINGQKCVRKFCNKNHFF
jgi:hypothetical protein